MVQPLVLALALVAAAPQTIVIKAGRLFDGTGDASKPNQSIVIEGDRIVRVGPIAEVAVPAGAEVIDLSDATVLPGLIDCHTHLASRADRFDEVNKFKRTPFHSAFAAVINAEKTLKAGFTTVRDVGSRPFMAVDLRGYIDEGFLVGPRVVASGPAISMTGGHGDLNRYSPTVHMEMYPEMRGFQIADGVDQVRQMVRAQVKYGVDVIKINASGGVMSRGDLPGAPQYSIDELRVAVQEAHALGRKVAAHAHGAIGIKNAVIAGVDSIEHGSMIDDEGIRLMIEKGTWLVSDIYNDDYLLGKAEEIHLPQESIDKERAIGQLQRDNFAKCVKAGVKIAFGTDAGVYPHGDNAKQFALMVKYGLTPARALRSATSDAAELIDRSETVGQLTPGHFADVIAVTDDPLQDVRALESVAFVMKGGRVVVSKFDKPITDSKPDKPVADRKPGKPVAAVDDDFGTPRFGSGREKLRGVEIKVGDPQFTLLWDTNSDLDLHVIEPGGKEIYWEEPKGAPGLGGELDVDMVKGYGPENIFWLKRDGEANVPGPPGEYKWFVIYWGSFGGIAKPTNWKVRIKHDGKETIVTGRLTRLNERSKEHSFRIDPPK